MPKRKRSYNPSIVLTQELVKEEFNYHPDGYLVRKTGEEIRGRSKSGKIKYWRVSVRNKLFYVHHVVFIWHHGYLPKAIDHINRDRYDNSIENLREATRQQNCYNLTRPKKTSIGNNYRGVNFYHRGTCVRWVANIRINGKKTQLGYFKTEEEAAMAYDNAAKEHHKEFAILNFPERR